MAQRFLTLLICFMLFAEVVGAKEILVSVTPAETYSTSNNLLQVGDWVKFLSVNDAYVGKELYIKKGTTVLGLLTQRDDNDFYGKEAQLYIEQFNTVNAKGEPIELYGAILKKGNNHTVLLDYVILFRALLGWSVRGGEAKLMPNSDFFTLCLKG